MKVTWEEYKNLVTEDIKSRSQYIYRGQSNSSWMLQTSIHRTKQVRTFEDFKAYFVFVIPQIQEQVEAWDGKNRDLSDPIEMAQFIAFLQHNGFPTPLLDWSFSPYVAAYFAFEGVNHFEPVSEEVALYSFDQNQWMNTFKQIYQYDDENEGHVTILRPTFRNNHKQMLQQGIFWFTNCADPEAHVRLNETKERTFLKKYTLSVKERSNVMLDLELMGVTAMQLAPGIESVCKKAFESICNKFPVGETPLDRSVNQGGGSGSNDFLVEAERVENTRAYINCRECNIKLNPKNLKKHLKSQHNNKC
jgi:hypothetical protein